MYYPLHGLSNFDTVGICEIFMDFYIFLDHKIYIEIM
jgi:hypothetical protein